MEDNWFENWIYPGHKFLWLLWPAILIGSIFLASSAEDFRILVAGIFFSIVAFVFTRWYLK